MVPYKRFNGRDGQSPSGVFPIVLMRFSGLSFGAKACWVALARYAGSDGKCYPSQAALAADLGTTTRAVRKYLEELEREGFIKRIKRYDCRGQATDDFEFLDHPIFAPGCYYRGRNNATSASGGGTFVPALVPEVVEQKRQGGGTSVPGGGGTLVPTEESQLEEIHEETETSKRITGGESQKPTIRPPGRPEGSTCDSVAEKQKADAPAGWTTAAGVLPALVPKEKPFPGRPGAENVPDLVPFAYESELAALRAKLAAYMGEEPPPDFEQKCFWRARGANVADICDLLDRKWALKKFRPDGRCGPRDWNWFLTVIGTAFSPIERGRLPEVPGMDAPVSVYVLARGIEAIEVVTADDSLVASYTCKCGAEIRQYASRIEGECRCQQNRRASPGKENGPGHLVRAMATGT